MTQLQVTGNTIKSAVVRAIHAKYPTVTIYKEQINENIKYPYFMVMVEDFTERKLIKENYLQTFIISIYYQYKDDTETSYTNLNQIGYELSDCLNIIELDNKELLRGSNKNWYPRNKELEFYINYSIKVYKPQSTVKQLHLSTDIYHK